MMSLLGILVGSIVSGAITSPILVIFAIIAAWFITGAGNTVNDYFDHETDAVNSPHRPIPSGKISRSDALIFSIIINLVGLAFAVLISTDFLIIALINTIVLAVYAWKLKKTPFLGNVSVSYLGASAFIAAGLITGTFSQLLGSAVLLLALISFLGTLSREILKDIRDIEGDKKIKAKTLPIVWGARPSRYLALSILYVGCILLIAPLYLGMFGLLYLVGALPAILICLYASSAKVKKAEKLIKVAIYFVFLGFILGSVF
jgi:geranylgeranylglycerol-phosphate geranylgeranyltransferase